MNAGLLTAWRIWDSIYYHMSRLQYVDKQSGNIFRIVVLPYRGETLRSKDGVEIADGDYVARIHIHNCRLAKLLKGINDENRMILIILREIRKSLPRLAEVIVHHPKYPDIKALIGTTMLYRGAPSLGFEVSDMENGWYQTFKTIILKIMLTILHPDGVDRLSRKPEYLIPKKVFMSTEDLIRRYGRTKAT